MRAVDGVLAIAAREAVRGALHCGEKDYIPKPEAYIEPELETAQLEAVVEVREKPETGNLARPTVPEETTGNTITESELPALVPSTTSRTKSPNSRFKRRRSDEVIRSQTTTWAIHNLVPAQGVVSVYGATGTAKSALCLYMADLMSRGRPLFGHIVTKKLRVIYVVLEGQGGMPARLRALEESTGQEISENLTFVYEQLSINQEEDVAEFADLVNRTGGTDVIIVDTLNRASLGADENRSSDMGRIIFGASYIQEKTNSLVILVHHSGKDESRGMRGHSSAASAMDVIIEVKRDGNGKRWWRLEKAKDGEDGISHSFELKVIDLGVDDLGLPLSSVTIQELDGAGPSTQKQASLGKNQLAVLVRFKLLMAGLSITEPDGPTGVTYADCVLHCKECVDVKDARHRTERVKEALNSLIKSGHIAESSGLLSLPG